MTVTVSNSHLYFYAVYTYLASTSIGSYQILLLLTLKLLFPRSQAAYLISFFFFFKYICDIPMFYFLNVLYSMWIQKLSEIFPLAPVLRTQIIKPSLLPVFPYLSLVKKTQWPPHLQLMTLRGFLEMPGAGISFSFLDKWSYISVFVWVPFMSFICTQHTSLLVFMTFYVVFPTFKFYECLIRQFDQQ